MKKPIYVSKISKDSLEKLLSLGYIVIIAGEVLQTKP